MIVGIIINILQTTVQRHAYKRERYRESCPAAAQRERLFERLAMLERRNSGQRVGCWPCQRKSWFLGRIRISSTARVSSFVLEKGGSQAGESSQESLQEHSAL